MTRREPPLVTVVTPMFNGEDHIAECVESVLAQSYEHWEYVITDNASSDGGPDIVKSFAARDRRIRYVRFDEFADVITSYNRAFDAVGAHSAYTKVVGADDRLEPDCLTRMVELAEQHPNVGLVSAYRLDEDALDLVGVPRDLSVVDGRQILRQSLRGGPYVTGSATSVLVRSELVRQRRPFYDATFRHADTEAAYWALTRSDFGFVHEVLTFTRRPPAGETQTATRLGSYWPENIRMLIRYGPEVFTPREYRRRLRHELRAYMWLHVKRRMKPSGRRDDRFHTFHSREIDLIRSEGGADPTVQKAMMLTNLLLGG